MADIFDPLDITHIPDEELALMDKFWAEYKSPANNSIGYTDFWHDYYSGTARKLGHNSDEWRLLALKLQELKLSFIAFCDAGVLYGKTSYTPKPAFQQGFLLRKQEQLKRLDFSKQIEDLDREKAALAKAKNALELEYRDSEKSRLQAVDDLGDCKKRNGSLEDENKDLKNQTSKWARIQLKVQLYVSVWGVPLLVLGLILQYLGTIRCEDKNVALTEERDRWKSLAESTPPQQGSSQSSVDAQASSHDSSKTRILVPYPTDAEAHVKPQQRTFKKGK